MSMFDNPDDMSVVALYKENIPTRFIRSESKEGLSEDWEDDLAIQYTIGSQRFFIRTRNGSIVDLTEGVESMPVIHVFLGEGDWRDVAAGRYEGMYELFTDSIMNICAMRKKTLATLKGTLRVNLKTSSVDVLPITLVYNGEDEPSATLLLPFEDWVSLHRKETTGQALFVSGRLAFTGDMHFLMRLQTLL
jgi:hypothetical protein